MAKYDRIIEWHELEPNVAFTSGDLEDLELLDGFPERIELGPYRFGWWLHKLLDWMHRNNPSLIDDSQL